MNLNKLSKRQSGLVFLFIYLFAMFVGFMIYCVGLFFYVPPWLLFLLIDVVMTGIIFLIGTLIKNASLYDPYWSVIPLFFLLIFAPVYGGSFRNLHLLLLLIAVTLWSVRLTYNWWKNWEGFQTQDWRYDSLKEKSQKWYPIINLVGIHLVPTIVVYFQMLVIFKIAQYSHSNLGYYIAFLLALSAPIIQFISDAQMYRFRKYNTTQSRVINTGLWRFSRHPNYFGELLFWVSIYLMYLSTYGKLDFYILSPLSMIALFVFISIPMMEQKLRIRPGYEEYQSRVSMIIPFFQKKSQDE